MTSFEWFLLVVVVILVPLIIAIVVTLWTIDQANKRKRANRADPQIGVKRKAALSEEEVAARRAARAARNAEAAEDTSVVTAPVMGTPTSLPTDPVTIAESVDAESIPDSPQADPAPGETEARLGDAMLPGDEPAVDAAASSQTRITAHADTPDDLPRS